DAPEEVTKPATPASLTAQDVVSAAPATASNNAPGARASRHSRAERTRSRQEPFMSTTTRPTGVLDLGLSLPLDGRGQPRPLRLPAKHLVTHGVVVGMTGSGKTGLVTVIAEEALRAGVSTLIVDVKGDLPNLLLAYPTFDPSVLVPWVASSEDALDDDAV